MMIPFILDGSNTVSARHRDETTMIFGALGDAEAFCAAPTPSAREEWAWVIVPSAEGETRLVDGRRVSAYAYARRVLCPALAPLPHGYVPVIREREEGGPRWGGSHFRSLDERDPVGLVRWSLPHEASDHELTSAMSGLYGQGEPQRLAAAEEWRRRYPNGTASRHGSKAWAADADKHATEALAA